MKKNQSGFTSVVIVLVVMIAIGVAVFIAWNMRSSQKAGVNQMTARYHFQAENNIKTIASSLEEFYFVNKYYPNSIDPGTLGDLKIELDKDVSAAPANTKYVFTPFPTGCTTVAKNCNSFSLSAVDVVTNDEINIIRSKSGK